MYLQILALLLIVVALARPTMWLDRRQGVSRILLIDNSASMNARDGRGGGTRLDEARRKAVEMVYNMGTGDQAMVVTFGGAPRVLQPFTPERATLQRAISRIESTDAEAGIEEALKMVDGVRKAVPDARLVILSDGGLGFLGNLIAPEDDVEFVGVGQENNNRAIVGFDVRES